MYTILKMLMFCKNHTFLENVLQNIFTQWFPLQIHLDYFLLISMKFGEGIHSMIQP
jgi:hypothetical protein